MVAGIAAQWKRRRDVATPPARRAAGGATAPTTIAAVAVHTPPRVRQRTVGFVIAGEDVDAKLESLKGQIIAEFIKVHGDIDVLVNNAANDDRHTLDEVTPEYWDHMQSINLKSYFFACQEAARQMKATGGAIVNFSSISYIMGGAGYTAYTTANGGITAMSRSLARELGPDKIRVNALAPGGVLTPKQLDKWATPDALAGHLSTQCLKEHLAPQDIVDAVLFLSSNTSRMMTGQCMVVDGGVVVTG
jgi:NAD(P)-dependent dehydrogenase (short-subunit alcohol dehydrogenase family)